jgi:murein DD-endopeptidase MepM/ murein hydrolase activator NlpD
VRAYWGVVVLVGLAGCTSYQPVEWDGRGSWAAARHASKYSSVTPDRGGQAYKVLPGETLSELAHRYRVPMTSLARLNGVAEPYRLHAGQTLVLPTNVAPPPVVQRRELASAAPIARPAVVTRKLPAPRPRVQEVQVAALRPEMVAHKIPAPLPRERLEASRKAAVSLPPPLSGNGFLWPVRGTNTSAFGSKPNGTRNDGINIRAAEGTPVVAAETGIVVYAGDEIPGYGRMLLISHADGFLTAYAHNRDLLVRTGERVERGQQVALVGRTGNVASPQLHFELRDGKEPVDPVVLLDAARTQVASVQ